MLFRSRHVEEALSKSFSGGGGKPSFPSPSAGDIGELPMVPLIGEGCCGVGGASRDWAGLGTMEEGLISRGDRKLRLPLLFRLQPQGPCRVGTGESGLVLSEEGNPAGLSSCVWILVPIITTKNSPLKRWEAQIFGNRGVEVFLATSS